MNGITVLAKTERFALRRQREFPEQDQEVP